MGPRKKFPYKNGEVFGNDVDFESKGEQFSIYNLEDGTVVKIKAALISIARLEGEYGPTGDPVYLIQAQNLIAVQVPDELKKQ